MNTNDEEPIEELTESEIAQKAQEKAQAAKNSELIEEIPAKETARFIPSRARSATIQQANSNPHLG
ncbi:MAG: hypothetical protein JWO08_4462 [Verrucomicrobiaceae bacterium]|nr:hypothetical protein [Verrucomicrobiaceae bacterium]